MTGMRLLLSCCCTEVTRGARQPPGQPNRSQQEPGRKEEDVSLYLGESFPDFQKELLFTYRIGQLGPHNKGGGLTVLEAGILRPWCLQRCLF